MERTYTLGRGVLFFKNQDGSYSKVGNLTEFKLSIKVEKLEHYNTESGLKVKDLELIKSVDATINFTTDELTAENLKRWFLGNSQTLTQSAGTVEKTFEGVKKGFYYDLGVRKVKSVTVTNEDGSVTYTEGDDYTLDAPAGIIYIEPNGSIADGSTIKVSAQVYSTQMEQVNALTNPTLEVGIWFKGDPPRGAVLDIIGEVFLRPDGDLSLVSDDWLTINFSGTLKPGWKAILREVR